MLAKFMSTGAAAAALITSLHLSSALAFEPTPEPVGAKATMDVASETTENAPSDLKDIVDTLVDMSGPQDAVPGNPATAAPYVRAATAPDTTSEVSMDAASTATTTGAKAAQTAEKPDAEKPEPVEMAAVDPAVMKRGKILFLRCRSCHSLKEGQPNKVGPNLHGFIGKQAGTNADFKYSPALQKADIVWSQESLMDFLKRPMSVVPGTYMAFAGLNKESDREAVIAYLMAETAE